MKIFFGFASPADYAKELINIKNVDKSKRIVEEIADRIKEINEKEKKTLRRHYRLLEKFLIIIKMLKVFIHRASKVDKRKSEPKIEESIAERMKLRRQKLDTIAKKKKKKKGKRKYKQ